MRFNVNDYVRVRLTEYGREAMRERTDELNAWIRQRNPHAEFLPYDAIVEDADGWSRWQLWHLMQCFGPRISMDGPNLFDLDIEIETKS